MAQSSDLDDTDRLAVLSFAVRLLLSEGNAGELLQRGVEALREFSGADGVAVLLLSGGVLRAAGGSGLDCPAETRVAGSTLEEILDSKRPQRARAFGGGDERLLCIPLVETSNEVSGLVTYRVGEIDATALQCLTILQAILAVGLQNARTIDDLRDANAKLGNLVETRGKLIQHLSHELKTPLSLISASAGLLERPLLRRDDERFARVLERLRRNVGRLCQIQEEAHDIAGSVPLDGETERVRTRLELLPLVRGALEEIGPLHRHRDVSVQLEAEPCPALHLPAEPLRKAVVGLVRNAVEATPDGGRVTVELLSDDEKVVLAVEDSGVGMDPTTLDQVFLGFVHAGRTEDYRSGRPYDFGAGGVGLDLLRTKQLAERFGFAVKARSEPGRGSRFELVFPATLRASEGPA